jgi:hypothetical protein
MNRLFRTFSLLAGLTLFSVRAFALTPELQTSCKVDLISSNPSVKAVTLTQESAPFSLDPLSSGSLQLSFANFTVGFGVFWGGNTGGSFDDLRPFLEFELYADGNPLQGSINRVTIEDPELAQRTIGKPFVLFGGPLFRDITIEGKIYTRADYSCRITRTK